MTPKQEDFSFFFSGTDVSVLNLASWPSAEDLELDDSQYRAIQMSLTKEFAVIQGPPGTGKTYIGLKVKNIKICEAVKSLSKSPPPHPKEKKRSLREYELIHEVLSPSHIFLC